MKIAGILFAPSISNAKIQYGNYHPAPDLGE